MITLKELFSPAVTLMNRLTYPRKMVLVVLVFSVPLTVFLYLLISETTRGIGFANKESLGVEYNKTVIKLMRNMQQHRGMANAYLSGDTIFGEKLTTKMADIVTDIKAIDRVDERLGTSLTTTDRWTGLKRRWRDLSVNFLDMEAMESFEEHTSIISDIRALMTHVADVSHLMLDPALDVFYLMDSMVSTLPRASEFEGQIRGFGAGAIVSRTLSSQEKANLIVLSGLCRSTLDEIKNNIEKVFRERPQIRFRLDVYLQETLSSGNSALDLLSSEVIFVERVDIEPLAYFEAFTLAIDNSFELHGAVTSSLENILEERIGTLKRKRLYIGAGAVAGFLCIIYLFTGHYFSVMNSLDRLVHVSEHIGRGELDISVSLDTRDEMAPVARSFNEMIRSLASYTDELKKVNKELKQEITERIRAEERIKESERKYRRLVDNALVGIYTSTLAGEFLYVNEAFVRMAEFDSIDEMLSENVGSRYKNPGERQVLIEELKETGTVDNFEIEMLTKNGNTKNIIVNVVLEGDIMSGMVMDITGRKKAENSLRESEEQYRVITDTTSDAIITIDVESRILFFNKAFEELFGYEKHELVGRQLTMLMPERFRSGHLSALDRYLDTGVKTANWKAFEISGLHKNGMEIPLEIAYGEFIVDGQHYFTGYLRNITDRKEAEKEKEYKVMLERFNRELEIIVAERTMSLMALRLADSVRNPASIIGWSGKRLIGKEDIPEKLKGTLATIIEEADKLEQTVKDFQSLMKDVQATFSYEDINEIVRSVLTVIEREASDKNITIEVDISDKPLKINAQKDLLKMAVFNMLRNAIEVTPEKGTVSISTFGDMNDIVFSVSDSGPGIPEEARTKIFDISYSAKIYRFGMGMPLIKQIVSEHLGEIKVESGKGGGATFRVIFPARWIANA